ncbi:MAG: murein L,D-transpeptidase catalytic domain family protein [Sphingobium sp.]
MHDDTRRRVLKSGLVIAGAALLGPAMPIRRKIALPAVPGPGDSNAGALPPSVAAAPAVPTGIRPELLGAAMAALDRHGSALARRDRVAIVDFAAPSADRRFHFLNLGDGRVRSLLVAHGSGSDPDHSGWVERFSNVFGSNASSEGAFVTRDYYVGKHGRSQRLVGLEPTNNNALERALVIHGAWYAEASMLEGHGKLGRSQGCFAVGDADLETVFSHLGPGRLIFAAKV